MNAKQQDMVAHALGLSAHPWRKGSRAARWAYRNFYAAGGDDEAEWRDLVEKGFAFALSFRICAEAVFSVTAEGAAAAGLLHRVPRKMRVRAALAA